jgi:cell division protein FtsQ
MRVMDKFGQSYYVDVNGIKFPLSNRYTPRVIVASGEIPTFDKPMEDLDSTHCIRQLFELSRILESDLFFQALVEQIYVDENGDMVLIPKIGTHDIVFGKVDENSIERLENLKIFYREAMPVTGWNEYKRLSIKYKDQVIASR